MCLSVMNFPFFVCRQLFQLGETLKTCPGTLHIHGNHVLLRLLGVCVVACIYTITIIVGYTCILWIVENRTTLHLIN